MHLRVILVVFDGAQSLDIFGPAEVFAAASRHLGRRAIDVVFASSGGGLRATSAGASVTTVGLRSLRPGAADSVLVVGGDEISVREASNDPVVRAWLVRAAPVVKRVGSVCSGAFVLASVGLLDGRRCATHWSATERLAALVPTAKVDKEAIFVVDGNIWTSAGVTTGIDMALAMVERDLGRVVADGVAARLVLYTRRPGFQSQFSDALIAQHESADPLGATLSWARRHLRDVNVPRLARQAGMSPRTLHRRTVEVLALTPAKLIERLRVEEARTLLSSTTLPQKTIAFRCGFRETARMQRALKRALGVDGKTVRVLFGRGELRA
jgi:transcriptional regulator GlxA family with amidase domain